MPLDFLTSVIPFFLVLAIVYGALDVSGVFKNRAANAVIAMVIAFFAMTSEPAVAFIMQVLPYAAILFVIIFFIGFVISFFRGKEGRGGRERGGPDLTLLAVIAVLIIIFLANQGYDALQDLLPSGFPITSENFALIIGIILIIAIIYAAYKSSKSER